MRGRIIAARACAPSHLGRHTAIEAAIFKALERALFDPKHPIHQRFNGASPSKMRDSAHSKPKR
jgi:hypothetical protein